MSVTKTRFEREFGRPYQSTTHTLASEVAGFDFHAANSDTDIWRYIICQALDVYNSRCKWADLETAAATFTDEPAFTPHEGLNAACAALVLYLAARDGFDPPTWALNPARKAQNPWYLLPFDWYKNFADVESPKQFQNLNVFITEEDLLRA